MRILLINPTYDGIIVAPHLGLGYLSSGLKKNGHEVKILDGLREKIEYDWFSKKTNKNELIYSFNYSSSIC